MFWDNVWNSDTDLSGSGLSQLLNSEDLTLEAVLANDRVLDEAAAGDRTLGSYLEQSSQLDSLISYIIQEPPPPGVSDPDSEEKKQYGYIASELLACPALALSEALFEHPEILDALFSVLLRPPPLDAGNIAYFRKVFEVLLRANFFALGDFLKGRGLIKRIVMHIGTYSMTELLRILIHDENRMSAMDNEWLVAEEVMPALVEALTDPERQENANQILIELALKCPGTDLVLQVSSGPLLETLVGMLTSSVPSVVSSTLPLITVIIQQNMKIEDSEPPPYRRPMNLPRGWTLEEPEEVEVKAPDGLPEIITRLLPVLDGLAKLLVVPPVSTMMQCGVHVNLGSLRLRVSHFFLALVQSGYPVVDDALANLESVKLLPVLFDMFFQYDWHNLYHSTAERIFNGVLLSKHVGLLTSLFIEGKFLQKAYSALEHAQTVQGRRAGNLGHILRILNAFSSWDDQYLVLSIIGSEASAEWVDFRDGLLNEENWRASPVDDLPSDPPPPTPDMYGVPPPESYIAGLSLHHDFGDSDDEPEGDTPRQASALDYNQGYGDAVEYDSDDDDEEGSTGQPAASGPHSEVQGIPCLGCGRMWEANENFCASCGRKRTPEERVPQALLNPQNERSSSAVQSAPSQQAEKTSQVAQEQPSEAADAQSQLSTTTNQASSAAVETQPQAANDQLSLEDSKQSAGTQTRESTPAQTQEPAAAQTQEPAAAQTQELAAAQTQELAAAQTQELAAAQSVRRPPPPPEQVPQTIRSPPPPPPPQRSEPTVTTGQISSTPADSTADLSKNESAADSTSSASAVSS